MAFTRVLVPGTHLLLIYVAEMIRIGRPPPWRDVQHRLEAAQTEDEAVEAIGALRELLDLEKLLIRPATAIE